MLRWLNDILSIDSKCHDFRKDFGIDLIGEKLVGKTIIDKKKIVKELNIRFDGHGRVYMVSFHINRPNEKLNQIRQRASIIKRLRENLGFIDYKQINKLMYQDEIHFDNLGYGAIYKHTEMSIYFTKSSVTFFLVNREMLEKSGDYEEVTKDYEKNKKEINL